MSDLHNIALTPNQTILLNTVILILIASALYRAERKLDGSDPWIMLSILAIFAIAGRILLDPLPNIQPVTVVVLLTGIYYGGPRAFALAGIVALATNFLVLGHGPWTLFQVVGWGSIGVAGALLSDRLLIDGKLNLNRLAVFAAVSGFVFNWIVSLSILMKTDPSMLIPYVLSGLTFDMYHAAGNILFVAWMAEPLGEMMLRHQTSPNHKAVSEVVTN